MRSLERTNPRVGALCILEAALAPMLIQNPVSAGLSLSGALLYTLVLRDREILKKGLISGLSVILFALFNGLFVHRGETVLFYSGENPVTAEAILSGALSGLCLWAVLWWLVIFSRLFTSDRLMYLVGGMFPGLSLLLSVTLRYVPLLFRTARELKDAQTGVGLYENAEGFARLKGDAGVFSALVGRSLEQGILTADSMAARGYGTGRRSFYGRYRMMPPDRALLLWALFLLAGFMGGLILGADYGFYPTVSRPSLLGELFCDVSCGLAAAVPGILEKGEQMKWKRFTAKI